MDEFKILRQEMKELYTYFTNHTIDISEKNFKLIERIGASMDEIRQSLTANQVGIANVYNAFVNSGNQGYNEALRAVINLIGRVDKRTTLDNLIHQIEKMKRHD